MARRTAGAGRDGPPPRRRTPAPAHRGALRGYRLEPSPGGRRGSFTVVCEARARPLDDGLRNLFGRAAVRLHHEIVSCQIVVIDPVQVKVAAMIGGLAGLDLA